jgi:hypothetical protein
MSVADDDDDILQETRLYCEISNKSVGGHLVSRSRPLTLTKRTWFPFAWIHHTAPNKQTYLHTAHCSFCIYPSQHLGFKYWRGVLESNLF